MAGLPDVERETIDQRWPVLCPTRRADDWEIPRRASPYEQRGAEFLSDEPKACRCPCNQMRPAQRAEATRAAHMNLAIYSAAHHFDLLARRSMGLIYTGHKDGVANGMQDGRHETAFRSLAGPPSYRFTSIKACSRRNPHIRREHRPGVDKPTTYGRGLNPTLIISYNDIKVQHA